MLHSALAWRSAVAASPAKQTPECVLASVSRASRKRSTETASAQLDEPTFAAEYEYGDCRAFVFEFAESACFGMD
jgi:hypothetical protein